MNKVCVIGNGVHATANILPSLKELNIEIIHALKNRSIAEKSLK